MTGLKRIRNREYTADFTPLYMQECLNREISKAGILNDCENLKPKVYSGLEDYLNGGEISMRYIITHADKIFPQGNNETLEKDIRDCLERRTGKEPAAAINEGLIGKIYSATTSKIKNWPVGIYIIPTRQVFLPENLPQALFVAEASHELAHDLNYNEAAATALCMDITLEFHQKYPHMKHDLLFNLWAYYSSATLLQNLYAENHFVTPVSTNGDKKRFVLGRYASFGRHKIKKINPEYTIYPYLLAKELISKNT